VTIRLIPPRGVSLAAVASRPLGAYLGARFSGEDRHRRRLAKVQSIETRYLASKSAPSR
jgi:hypothetical protein